MKYKVGNKVRIKNIDWYKSNETSEFGYVDCGEVPFIDCMTEFCGRIVTISKVRSEYNYYDIEEDNGTNGWTDEMIEGLVEEKTKNNNDMEEKETLLGWVKESDSLRLVPHKDYEIKHDGDNFYLVKKKKEYPKTFLGCCDVLRIEDTISRGVKGYKSNLLDTFQKLLICRDAYWKIAGEEMGLGKPWEPYWSIYEHKFCIGTNKDKVIEECVTTGNRIIAFPTAEMRDAFYENFKDLIEQCKELL